MASAPMTTALVGVSRFTRPQADWNAVMITSRPTPAKSASGAMTGMDRVARPEVDGMRKDSGK